MYANRWDIMSSTLLFASACVVIIYLAFFYH